MGNERDSGLFEKEMKRAIEAVVLVAHEPVAPELLAQLLEQPVVLVESWLSLIHI